MAAPLIADDNLALGAEGGLEHTHGYICRFFSRTAYDSCAFAICLRSGVEPNMTMRSPDACSFGPGIGQEETVAVRNFEQAVM